MTGFQRAAFQAWAELRFDGNYFDFCASPRLISTATPAAAAAANRQ